jgi:hypothetical protein
VGKHVGDWFVFFDEPRPCSWGLAEIVCTECRPQPKDRVVCYQSSIGEVVGTARVVGYQFGHLILHAIEGPFPRGVKISELKKIDRRIHDLDAFRQGLIKTLYRISDGDADHLLNTIKRFWVDADN